MPKRKMPKDYCPIRFLVWSPEADSMLDYEWAPNPKKLLPLRVRAHHAGLKIIASDIAIIRQRLAAIGAEIERDRALLQFQAECAQLQQQVRELLGVRI